MGTRFLMRRFLGEGEEFKVGEFDLGERSNGGRIGDLIGGILLGRSKGGGMFNGGGILIGSGMFEERSKVGDSIEFSIFLRDSDKEFSCEDCKSELLLSFNEISVFEEYKFPELDKLSSELFRFPLL